MRWRPATERKTDRHTNRHFDDFAVVPPLASRAITSGLTIICQIRSRREHLRRQLGHFSVWCEFGSWLSESEFLFVDFPVLSIRAAKHWSDSERRAKKWQYNGN
jgi:hypothetical protein